MVTLQGVQIIGEGRRVCVTVAAPRGRVLVRMEQGAQLDALHIEADIEPHWGQARLELLRGDRDP